MSTSAPLNRRSFLKGAGTAAAATVAAGALATPALADETAEEPVPTASCEFGQFDENGVYTPAFLIPPAPISDHDVVETYDADVVVVGMGLSGICAARAALEEGASSAPAASWGAAAGCARARRTKRWGCRPRRSGRRPGLC